MRFQRAFSVILLTIAASSPAAAQTNPGRAGYVPTADGARLFFRVEGTAPDTLIAIHGGPGVDLESIAGDFAPLALKHTIIFYDQRGAGRSTLPADTARLNAAQQVADLDAVRAHFRIDKATLIAHSYGPLLAATYAIAHPDHVRRMVLLGPVPPRRGDFWARFARNSSARMDSTLRGRLADANKRLMAATSRVDIRSACRDYWQAAMVPRLAEPARTLPLIKSDLCGSDEHGIQYGLSTTNRVVMASYGDWDLRAKLRTLHVPTLVVHGEAEAIPMDLVEEWVASLPDAKLVRVPNAAHFAYAERPDIVWPAVEHFLSVTSSRP
jgi:proline iminopeptidase